jgi:hypothetical protein
LLVAASIRRARSFSRFPLPWVALRITAVTVHTNPADTDLHEQLAHHH